MKKEMHNLSEHGGKDDYRMGIWMRTIVKKTSNLQGIYSNVRAQLFFAVVFRAGTSESIEWFVEDQAFSLSYDLAPPPPPPPPPLPSV
jgi:hypothetical protein